MAVWLSSILVGAINSVPLVCYPFSSISVANQTYVSNLILIISGNYLFMILTAPKDHGIGWSWIHGMVCLPISSVQGNLLFLVTNKGGKLFCWSLISVQ